MISKKIHFVWLGKGKYPKSFILATEGIKKYAAEYEVKVWTEEHMNEFDLPELFFTLLNKKQNAFASDILRFHILNKYGGIYFDIDQVLVKGIDDLLNNKMFISTYHQVSDYYGFGLVGVEAEHKFLKEIIDFYNNFKRKEFMVVNKIGSEIINKIIEKEKMANTKENSIKILSQDYFYPLEGHCAKTENTRSYHLANTSWIPWYRKILYKIPNYLFIKKLIFNMLPKSLINKISKTKYL